MTDTSEELDPATNPLGRGELLLGRFLLSLMSGSRLAKPGEPIEVDWGYVTGEVDAPRTYDRTRRTEVREGDNGPGPLR